MNEYNKTNLQIYFIKYSKIFSVYCYYKIECDHKLILKKYVKTEYTVLNKQWCAIFYFNFFSTIVASEMYQTKSLSSSFCWECNSYN